MFLDLDDLTMTDIGNIIQEISDTPHFRTMNCSQCGKNCRVHALQIYCRCTHCGNETKCRSFGAVGTELVDVIDAVLKWAGEGETFDAVMDRYQEILSDKHR